jgi:hypothetical protein
LSVEILGSLVPAGEPRKCLVQRLRGHARIQYHPLDEPEDGIVGKLWLYGLRMFLRSAPLMSGSRTTLVVDDALTQESDRELGCVRITFSEGSAPWLMRRRANPRY